MAVLTIQNGTNGLQDVTTTPAAGGGDTVAQGTRVAGHDLGVVLVVRNADATTTTVTVNGVGYVVPATTGLALIPIFGTYFGAAVPVTYSKVTSLTVGAVRFAPAP
jgi:hypothetical protein